MCPICGKPKKSKWTKTCSHVCGGKLNYQTSEKVRAAIAYGQTKNDETKRIEAINRTKGIPRVHLRGENYPNAEKRKSQIKGLGLNWAGKPRMNMRGENHPCWRGGVTGKRRLLMNHIDYITFRKTVMKRDNYTCQFCKQRGGKLVVDHIKPYVTHPELHTTVENGRVLCFECHLKTDTFGHKAKLLKLTQDLKEKENKLELYNKAIK